MAHSLPLFVAICCLLLVSAEKRTPDNSPVEYQGVLPVHLRPGSASQRDTNVQCLDALDCNSCLSEPSCGWCQGKKCVPGSFSGPYSGSCSSWSYDFCPNQPVCSYSSCQSCLNDPNCGWCSNPKHCFEGNATQPLDGNCPSSDYFYTSCPGSATSSVDYLLTFPNAGTCDLCNEGGNYICFDGSFATASSTNFLDPTPRGSTVIQIKLAVTGVYAQQSYTFTLDFNLNNSSVSIPVDVTPNSNGFTCDAACTTYGGQSEQFSSGIPTWVSGGTNFIGWSGYTTNNACYYQLDLTIIYLAGSGDQTPQEKRVTVKQQ